MMAELNGLPVYKIKINESLESNEGIDFVSLVDYPAIETNWVALAEKKPLKFTFNKDQKLLFGPIMIPDMPIYRFSFTMGEYYVVFTKEEIQKLVRKLQKQRKTLNLNYQHQPDSQVEAVIQEIWLTGKSDKSKDYGFNLPEGSAFVVTYVENDKFWNDEVKSGNVKGYSIEGFLDMELKKHNMQKFVEAKTTEGLTLKTPSETWANGVDAVIVDADGKETPAEGEYTLENGTVVKCMGGKVTEIVEPEMENELTPEEAAIVQSAMKSIVDGFEKRIKELEDKFSKLPGSVAASSHTDTHTPTPKESLRDKVISLRKITEKK